MMVISGVFPIAGNAKNFTIVYSNSAVFILIFLILINVTLSCGKVQGSTNYSYEIKTYHE
jgi:hypothetical protein